MHNIEDFVETGEWAKPCSNPMSTSPKMAEQIKHKAADVDEIWGSEVNLYMLKCMQAQLIL